MLTAVAGLRLSADGLTAYFYGSSTSFSVLYTAQRTELTETFGGIRAIQGAALNANEMDPTVGSDGWTLIFSVQTLQRDPRPTHLHYLVRDNSSTSFIYVGALPNVNAPSASDDRPFLREDGQVLYFGSTRNSSGDADIYRAPGNGSSFGPVSPVRVLNSPYDDDGPVVTPDDLTIYFASKRPYRGSSSAMAIWVSTRATTAEAFSEPTNVSELNSDQDKTPTFVSRDGCSLYFSAWKPPSGGLLGTTAQYVARKPDR
jgi:Tol biopolymer transport system component